MSLAQPLSSFSSPAFSSPPYDYSDTVAFIKHDIVPKQDVDNILDHLHQDHMFYEDIMRVLENSQQLGITLREKKQIFNELIQHLARHADSEEMVIFPLVKDNVTLTYTAEAENLHTGWIKWHKQFEDIASAMDNHVQSTSYDVNGELDPEYDVLVKRFIDYLRNEIRFEEQKVMVAMVQALSKEKMRELRDSMEHAIRGATTRPHPWKPYNATLNALVEPVVKAVDVVRDYIENREFTGKSQVELHRELRHRWQQLDVGQKYKSN